MAKAAFAFPDRIHECPQRTHAVLTKYTSLQSYQVLASKGSPLDYENVGVYTNSLLEHYLEYKDIWKHIQPMTNDYNQNKTILTTNVEKDAKDIKNLKSDYEKLLGPVNGKGEKVELKHIPIAPYEDSYVGLEKARRDCRLQMIQIIKEVDAVSENPMFAVGFDHVGVYLAPVHFRQLLPENEPGPTDEEIKKAAMKHKESEAKMGDWENMINGLTKSRTSNGRPNEDTSKYNDLEKKVGELEAIMTSSIRRIASHVEQRNDQKIMGNIPVTNGLSTKLTSMDERLTRLDCEMMR